MSRDERADGGSGRRLFLEPNPPPLNHMIATGMLVGYPQTGRRPTGEAVTRMAILIPVFDPEHLQDNVTWASCGVEAPAAIAAPAGQLSLGASVLVAGRLGQRPANGGTGGCRNVLLAAFVHPDSPPEPFVVGGSPGPRPEPYSSLDLTDSRSGDAEKNGDFEDVRLRGARRRRR